MLDKALIEALAEVVKEEGQPSSVALRLTAWLTQLSENDLGKDEHTQLFANVREALVLEADNAD